MSAELRTAIDAHSAAVGSLEELRAMAREQGKGLSEASERRASTGETLTLALGREKLKEITAAEIAPLHAEHDAAVREERASVAACDLLIPRVEKAQANVATAAARVRGVAQTEAALLLPKYIATAQSLMMQLAGITATVFELEALSRGSTELASGENAAPIGGPLHDMLAAVGLGLGRGINGNAFIGPAPGRKATMTAAELLELATP